MPIDGNPTGKTVVTPTTDNEDVLRIATQQYVQAWQGEQQNLDEAYDDLRFQAGEQWSTEVINQRGKDRISLIFNRLPQFVRQITGDMRLNKPSIKVRPAGGQATDEIAEIFTGLIRNIETESSAPRRYVQAGQDAVRQGFGAIRLVTEYADVDMFEQDIRIKWVPNSLGIMFDPNAKEQTRKDARYCFVPTKLTYERFKQDWPEAQISSWDQFKPLNLADIWCDPLEVTICEYWAKYAETQTLCRMGNGDTFLAESPPKMFQKIPAEELIKAAVKTRKVDVDCVYQWIMTGAEVLDGPNKWAGRFIPIVPVIGEEINVGDRIVRHGAIRWAKDAQRAYNFHQTTATEAHALAPKAPFIGTAEQFKGYEKEWRQANTRNLPYLRYNPDPQASGPPQRSNVDTNIGASMALAEQAANDMYATIGIYPPSLGQKSNETSGRAIQARQKEADVGTYVYIDNLAAAIEEIGKQLVDLIPKIYDTERIVRVLHEDDESEQVTINKFDAALAKVENDLTAGKYDVVVEVGPAFSTRRQESAQEMQGLLQSYPEAGPLIADLYVDAQDWPNKDKIKERLKRALPPGIDDEVDEERKQRLGPQQPNPAEQLQLAKLAGDAQKATAGAKLTEAQTVGQQLTNLTLVGQTSADVAKQVADTEGTRLDNLHKATDLGHKHGQMRAGVHGQADLMPQEAPAPAKKPTQ